jgi:hypothetical protein
MRGIWNSTSGVEGKSGDKPALFNVDEVEELMQGAARAGNALSYSDALMALGYRFSRPKMRALCVVLDAVDQRAAARGEPELAVLVVRESDKLPGQGWWVGRPGYVGEWTGPAAFRHISALQQAAFDYWRDR